MQKKIITCAMLIFISGTVLLKSCYTAKPSMETKLKNYYSKKLDSCISFLNKLHSEILQSGSEAKLKELFIKARVSYKKVEAFTEYYFQGLTKRINGPALPDVKTDDNQVWPAAGFQVIEQHLYENFEECNKTVLINDINNLIADLRFTITNLAVLSIKPNHLSELLQHQIIRIATLGIVGFDTPLSKATLIETKAALQGIMEIEAVVKKSTHNNLIAVAINYVQENDDVDNFDRLHFITTYLMPIGEALNIAFANNDANTNKPFVGTLRQLLSGKSWNADYYANYALSKTNITKVTLGKMLFYDTKLSKSGTMSCASCHKPELYFTDGLTKAANFVHGGVLARNTPTLLYSALQNNQFYDMRSVYLEDQINEVMNNSNEFNLSAAAILNLVKFDTTYTTNFKKAFSSKDSITSYAIRNAIASYVRTLLPFNSKFDDYMRGDTTTLTATAKLGFNLFAGKAKCATCHFIPLFNGTIPPWYSKTESEVIGVPQQKLWTNATIDADTGRYQWNALAPLKYSFKTPTIRNSSKTAPYMHNGIYNTLDEVVTFYQKGGGVGIGISLTHQTLPFDSLALNDREKKAIVVFMETLTDNALPK